MSRQQGQHFLLSTAAQTLSLAKVLRMSDQEAWEAFKAVRWASTEGDPICPRFGCVEIYSLSDNRRYLHAYAAEMGWREDHRRVSNGGQYLAVTAAALGHPVSRQWCGYWQRVAL